LFYPNTLTNFFSFHKVLKKEEQERVAKEGTKGKRVSTGQMVEILFCSNILLYLLEVID